MMRERVLTVRQPWADLIVAGVKDVENRTWPVPSTLPQWGRCDACECRYEPPPPASFHGSHCRRGHDGVAVEPDGPFPFRLGIHAAQKVDRDAVGDVAVRLMRDEERKVAPISVLISTAPDRRGVLVGFVTVTDCHHADECGVDPEEGVPYAPGRILHCSRWSEPDVYHWLLADPEPLDTPVPMRGAQRLWTLPEAVTADG